MLKHSLLAATLVSAVTLGYSASAAPPPVSTNRAEVINARGYAYDVKPATAHGRVSAILAVSAVTYNGCQSLRLIPADDPATPALEIAALVVSPEKAVCTQVVGEDVATLDFVYPRQGRTARVLGRNKVLNIVLPPLPQR